jgi:hypothetical protein
VFCSRSMDIPVTRIAHRAADGASRTRITSPNTASAAAHHTMGTVQAEKSGWSR